MGSWNRSGQLLQFTSVLASHLGIFGIALILCHPATASTPPISTTSIIAIIEPSPLEILTAARELKAAGNYTAAIPRYQQLLDSSDAKVRTNAQSELAWIYAYQKNYDASLQLCDRLIPADPASETWQIQRAQILSWAKRYPESLQAYQQILAKNPQSLAAQLGYAEVSSWDGQYDQALRSYQQVLAADPSNEAALTGVAYIALWKSSLDDALAKFNALRRQFPKSTAIQLGLAKTYIARQDIKSAKSTLQPLISANNSEAIGLTKAVNTVQSNTEFDSRSRSSQQNSLTASQTITFQLGYTNLRQAFQVGYGKFTQPGRDVLNTVPIRVGIAGANYPTQWQVSVGGDVFDRLSAQPFVEGQIATQLSPTLQVGAVANYQAYKENVETLENGIKLLRIQPYINWLITPSTSLYAQYGAGFYSDGNRDGQLWAGLKQSVGHFYVEGSVLSWRYAKDFNHGYFAPSDYFSYAGELGWQGKLADPATCQLAVSLGRQSYDGQSRPEQGYKAGCRLELSPTTRLDALYRYSSNALLTGEGANSNEHRVQVNLKTQF
jgi:tetratricopeptide (TPR) repeat protein